MLAEVAMFIDTDTKGSLPEEEGDSKQKLLVETIGRLYDYSAHRSLKRMLAKIAPDELAEILGATRTPEVFVLDREGNVRYQGRIDDQYSFGLTAGYAKPKSAHQRCANIC
jgi:hypothetical protein